MRYLLLTMAVLLAAPHAAEPTPPARPTCGNIAKRTAELDAREAELAKREQAVARREEDERAALQRLRTRHGSIVVSPLQ